MYDREPERSAFGCSPAKAAVLCALMCLAIPGKITSISGEEPLTRMGKIDFGGILKEASLAYVPDASIGDYVIVHVGFAISRLDEDEAQQVFKYLRQMEDLSEVRQGQPPLGEPGLQSNEPV